MKALAAAGVSLEHTVDAHVAGMEALRVAVDGSPLGGLGGHVCMFNVEACTLSRFWAASVSYSLSQPAAVEPTPGRRIVAAAAPPHHLLTTPR